VKPDDPKADNQEPKPVLLTDIIAAGWKSVKAAPESNKESSEARLYRQEQESMPWVGKRLIMRGEIGFAGPDMRPGARTNDNQQPYTVGIDYVSSRKVVLEGSFNKKTRVPAETVSIAFRGLGQEVLALKRGTPAAADIVIESVRFGSGHEGKTLNVLIVAASGSWK